MKINKEDIVLYVNNFKKGDRDAFLKLYLDNVNQVYYVCLRLLKNEDDAKDITQETFVTAMEKIDTLNQPESFSTWVNHIAVNKCKNLLQRNSNVIKSDLYDNDVEETLEEMNEDFIPESYIQNKEQREIIMDIIENKLSDVQRVVILLYYYEKMSVSEIAGILECSEGTVKSRLNSARAIIKKAIEHKEKQGISILGMVPLFILFSEDAKAQLLENEAKAVMHNTLISVFEKNKSLNIIGEATYMVKKSIGLKIAGISLGAAAIVGAGIGIALFLGGDSDDEKTTTPNNGAEIVTTTKEYDENDTEDKSDNSSEDITTDGFTKDEMDENDIVDYIIDNEGKLPIDIDSKTVKGYIGNSIAGYLLKSFISLDAEAMKPYIDSRDYKEYKEHFDRIKEDAEAVELWNATMGNITYFPKSNIIIGKDVGYVYASWYTDCYRNKEEIPGGSGEELPKEYVIDIYNKYYVNAPYTIGFTCDFDYDIKDGYITFDIEEMLDHLGMDDLDDLLEPNTYKQKTAFNYGKVILGGASSFGLGYEYLLDGEELKFSLDTLEAFLNKDMDKVIEITKEYDASEESDTFWECFEKYYLNDAYKEKIVKYIEANCVILRTLSYVVMYYPAEYDLYPLNRLEEDEMEILKALDINVVNKKYAYKYPTEFSNSFSMFYEVVDIMKHKGLLD